MSASAPDVSQGRGRRGDAWEVLRVALRLGLTSFGGPIAHLGYFERTYVRERRWLTGEQYGGLVALCQLLPGPASSQVGVLVGLHRAGWAGALAAWIGFTLPSALLMFACAIWATHVAGAAFDAVLHGLKLLAVAVVAQAVWSMGRRLCTAPTTLGIAIAALVLSLAQEGAAIQLGTLLLGALAGLVLRCGLSGHTAMATTGVPPVVARVALLLFAVLMIGLPVAAQHAPHGTVAFANIFYRAGALVFGGGHVVLPLLRDALVPGGWISDDSFLAGYGLAQAMPGPLFAVAAHLGAASDTTLPPALGASIALLAIFLPGLLLAFAGAALWERLARSPRLQRALAGINAAVVGILAAAFLDPVCSSAIRGGADAAIAIVGVLLLQRWNMPPIVVLGWSIAASFGAR